MKPKRKGAKRNVLEALPKGSNADPIKDGAWNFAECPHPQQTEVCFLYEYSLESKKVKAEVAVMREKSQMRLYLLEVGQIDMDLGQRRGRAVLDFIDA